MLTDDGYTLSHAGVGDFYYRRYRMRSEKNWPSAAVGKVYKPRLCFVAVCSIKKLYCRKSRQGGNLYYVHILRTVHQSRRKPIFRKKEYNIVLYEKLVLCQWAGVQAIQNLYVVFFPANPFFSALVYSLQYVDQVSALSGISAI